MLGVFPQSGGFRKTKLLLYYYYDRIQIRENPRGLSDVYSVASFYAQFKFSKPGRHIIKVCKGTACHVRGSGSLLAALEERLGIKEGGTTADGLVSLERVACLGACALAPAMVVDGKVHARVTLAEIEKILKSLK